MQKTKKTLLNIYYRLGIETFLRFPNFWLAAHFINHLKHYETCLKKFDDDYMLLNDYLHLTYCKPFLLKYFYVNTL